MKNKFKIFLLLLGIMVAIFAMSYKNPLTSNLSQNSGTPETDKSSAMQMHSNNKTINDFSNFAKKELIKAGQVFTKRLMPSQI